MLSPKIIWSLYHHSSFPSYTCCCQDHPIQPWHPLSGDTAILVHRWISHRSLPPSTTTLIKGYVVVLESRQIRHVHCFSISLAWSADSTPSPECDAFLDHPLPTIIVSDLNPKHPFWNSRTANTFGNSLCGPEDLFPFPLFQSMSRLRKVLGKTEKSTCFRLQYFPAFGKLPVPICCLLYTSRCV